MKNFLLAGVIAVIGTMQFSNAALLIYTDTKNVDPNGESFVFNQFNPALGTLTAIDLLINASSPSGSALVTNNSPTSTVTIRYIRSALDIYDDAGLGFNGYFGSDINLDSTPTAKSPSTFVLAASSAQNFTGHFEKF